MKKFYLCLIIFIGIANIFKAQNNNNTGVENYRIGLNYFDSFDGEHIFGLSVIQTRKSLKEYEASLNYDYETGFIPTTTNVGIISNIGVNFFLTDKNKYYRIVSFIPSVNLYFMYTKQTNSHTDQNLYWYDDTENYYIGLLVGFKINFKCSERLSLRLQFEYGPALNLQHFNFYQYSYSSIYTSINNGGNTNGFGHLLGIPFIQVIYRLK